MEQPLVVNDEERPAASDGQSCVSKWVTPSYIANFGVQVMNNHGGRGGCIGHGFYCPS